MSAREHAEAQLGWALLIRCGLFTGGEVRELWTLENGPTALCRTRAEDEVGSSSEVLFLRAALDTWNRHGNFNLGRAIAVLDETRLRLLAELLLSLAGHKPHQFVDEARRLVESTTAVRS